MKRRYRYIGIVQSNGSIANPILDNGKLFQTIAECESAMAEFRRWFYYPNANVSGHVYDITDLCHTTISIAL